MIRNNALLKFVQVFSSNLAGLNFRKKDKEWNNRLLIFDADAFGFRSGASLKENQTNPLYLLYLAYLRTRNLEKLGIGCDMMICSKNMFLKFNPAKLDEKTWTNFKRALFRIIDSRSYLRFRRFYSNLFCDFLLRVLDHAVQIRNFFNLLTEFPFYCTGQISREHCSGSSMQTWMTIRLSCRMKNFIFSFFCRLRSQFI